MGLLKDFGFWEESARPFHKLALLGVVSISNNKGLHSSFPKYSQAPRCRSPTDAVVPNVVYFVEESVPVPDPLRLHPEPNAKQRQHDKERPQAEPEPAAGLHGSNTASNNSSKLHTCPASFAIIAALGRFLPLVPGIRVCQQ